MQQNNPPRVRPVAIWLLSGVFMIVVQIILGGITRLTDSGLSITEWKPILGALPPLNEGQWQKAFEQYKHIAQFHELHAYFTLEDFKSIFFWEWLHRLWGRLIGIVFIVPFVIFLIQKRFQKTMIRPMVILFILGGLQGLIGWIMVQSGLNDEDIYVSHIRLAVHFIVALGLLTYTFVFALQLLVDTKDQISGPAPKKLIWTILVLLVMQLIYGAFMAGLKAAPAAPTWPDINGTYLPSHVYSFGGRVYSFSQSLVNNPLVVHFIHRNTGYLIFFLILIWTFRSYKMNGSRLWNRAKWFPLFFVILQVSLGIASLLTSPHRMPRKWGVFEWNAQLHQFVALLLLLSIVLCLFLFHKTNAKNARGIDAQHI